VKDEGTDVGDVVGRRGRRKKEGAYPCRSCRDKRQSFDWFFSGVFSPLLGFDFDEI